MAAPVARRRRGSRAVARWRTTTYVRRHLLHSEGPVLLGLSLFAAGFGALFVVDRSLFPVSMLALVVLTGGFLLSVRRLLLLDLVVAAVVALEVSRVRNVSPGAILVVVGTAAMVHLLARSRGRLGVQGTRGDSMLVDLRDRLTAQGEMPLAEPSGETSQRRSAVASPNRSAAEGQHPAPARSSDRGLPPRVPGPR